MVFPYAAVKFSERTIYKLWVSIITKYNYMVLI